MAGQELSLAMDRRIKSGDDRRCMDWIQSSLALTLCQPRPEDLAGTKQQDGKTGSLNVAANPRTPK